MPTNKNDNWNITAPKAIDQRTGKFVAGVWQPFASVTEANTLISSRHKGLTVNILSGGEVTEFWYKEGTTDGDLVLKIPKERSYNSFSSLSTISEVYPTGTIISTKGFYTPGDGGQANYIISSTPISGLEAGSPVQVAVPGGRYAQLYHLGSVNLEQFGAKGDGTTNDYNAFKYAGNFKKVDDQVTYIYGKPNSVYYIAKQSRAMNNAGDFNFYADCFLRVDYSGVTWDGRGSKIVVDNNINQSRVYLVKSGMTHVYRAKLSNVGQYPGPNNMSENSWYDYYWQMMEYNVTPNGSYPYWSNTTQYYGAQNFAALGYYPSAGLGKVENVTFRNWDISGGEIDTVANDSGMWNIFAKGFNLFYGYDNIVYDSIKLHNFASEMFYGGANTEAGRQTIKGCKIYKGHNGISGGGFPFYIQDNEFEDLNVNAIENFPFDGKLVITGNSVKRCGNGFTIGGPGNDIQTQGHVTIDNNTIDDVLTYGIYFSGRARGVTVSNNILYDAGISFYMLSNLGFPMVASEYMVVNNQIYANKEDLSFALTFNSAYSDNGNYTTNIKIQGNIIGTTALTDVLGYNKRVATAVSFTGDLYKDIIIDGNSFIGRITQFYEYIVKSTYWSPIFGKNYYRATYSDNHITGIGNGTAYNAPTSFDVRYIKGDNQLIQVGSAPPSDGWSTGFFIAPHIHNIGVRVDNLSSFICTYFSIRVVLVPSGNDNLKRAFIMRNIYNGSGQQVKTGVSLKLVQSNTCFEGETESRLRSWEYEGLNETIRMPDVMSFYGDQFFFGPLAAGASSTYSFHSDIIFNGNYDQFFMDRDVPNNFLLVPGITHSFSISYSGNYSMTVTYTNTTGAPIERAGYGIAWKAYPVSNPTALPTYIAPLRSEGLTNMRPTGSDVPNKFVFRDVQTNQYLEYNKITGAWEVPGSTGSGSAAKDSFTLTTTGSRAVEADKDVVYIRVNPSADLAAFKIGTTAGGDDILPTTAVPAGNNTFNVGAYFAAAGTLHFTGITSSTLITVIKI